MKELRRVLTTCTNLQKLSVTSVYDATIRGGQMLLEPGMHLPHLRFLMIRGLQLADYNTPGWETCVAWDTLEYLESSDASLVSLPSLLLNELRSMTLIESQPLLFGHEQALFDLIYTSTKLVHLTLTGLFDLVVESPLLEHKGEFLKTWRLHEHDRREIGRPRPMPDKPYIRRLGNRCPRLETCAIDIQAGPHWVSGLFLPSSGELMI